MGTQGPLPFLLLQTHQVEGLLERDLQSQEKYIEALAVRLTLSHGYSSPDTSMQYSNLPDFPEDDARFHLVRKLGMARCGLRTKCL